MKYLAKAMIKNLWYIGGVFVFYILRGTGVEGQEKSVRRDTTRNSANATKRKALWISSRR